MSYLADCEKFSEILYQREKQIRSFVYFIEAIGLDRVKIGKAKDPEKRMAELQTASPAKLRLLGMAVGGHLSEASIHRALQSHRVGGEWFEVNRPVLLTIADIVEQGFVDPAVLKRQHA